MKQVKRQSNQKDKRKGYTLYGGSSFRNGPARRLPNVMTNGLIYPGGAPIHW